MREKIQGHILALITIIIWGVTYIASTILLEDYNAVQVIVFRLIIAYAVLWAIKPNLNPPTSVKNELLFIVLALFGVVIYFLFENAALAVPDASPANVSIIISFAPVATTIGMSIVSKEEKLTLAKIIGFFVAIAGVVLVVFNGAIVLKINPKGDLLAIGAMISWALYSLVSPYLLKRFDNILLTRRCTFYSLIPLAVITLIRDGLPNIEPLLNVRSGGSLLLLGILGSGLCYLWWNKAIKTIGVVITTNYLYLSPFVTMISAWLILGKDISVVGIIGAVLIIGGIVVSNKQSKKVK